MGTILVAMPGQDDAGRIAMILKRSGLWEDVRTCRKGADALNAAENEDVSLVICTKRLRDMGYEELASYLPPKVNIILLTSDAGLMPFSSNIVRLLMPFRTGDLIATVKLLMPAGGYVRKKKRPPRSEEEQKLIDMAKKMLMENNDMSEPEAFRYMQKNSMDSGRSLVETAQMLLMLEG